MPHFFISHQERVTRGNKCNGAWLIAFLNMYPLLIWQKWKKKNINYVNILYCINFTLAQADGLLVHWALNLFIYLFIFRLCPLLSLKKDLSTEATICYHCCAWSAGDMACLGNPEESQASASPLSLHWSCCFFKGLMHFQTLGFCGLFVVGLLRAELSRWMTGNKKKRKYK